MNFLMGVRMDFLRPNLIHGIRHYGLLSLDLVSMLAASHPVRKMTNHIHLLYFLSAHYAVAIEIETYLKIILYSLGF